MKDILDLFSVSLSLLLGKFPSYLKMMKSNLCLKLAALGFTFGDLKYSDQNSLERILLFVRNCHSCQSLLLAICSPPDQGAQFHQIKTVMA
jgi:hypothetical protein